MRTLKPTLATANLSRVGQAFQSAQPNAVKRDRSTRAQKRRLAWLTAHPLCVHCKAEGRINAARELDHIVPLWNGGADDERNLQGLCVEHHRTKTAREAAERAGL